MANTCNSSWVLKGLTSTIGLIAATIDNVSNRPKAHSWDRPVLRDVAPLLRLPEEGLSFSEITHFTKGDDPNILRIDTEEDDTPPVDFFDALRKRFPDLKVRYRSECFENDLFETNDKEGEFFPERFALDFETEVYPEGDPVNYFHTEKELTDFVQEHFGLSYKTYKDVVSYMENDLLDMDEDAFVSLHRADVVDTLR